MKVIDGTGLILGRMVSQVAKLAMQGEKIAIVNCEKVIISGDRNQIFAHYLKKRQRGEPFHGPLFPKRADLLVRRAVRGMLPITHSRGREAYKRVMCYLGIPVELADQHVETLGSASANNLRSPKSIKIETLSERLGA